MSQIVIIFADVMYLLAGPHGLQCGSAGQYVTQAKKVTIMIFELEEWVLVQWAEGWVVNTIAQVL